MSGTASRITERVRKIYDDHPYPAVDRVPRTPFWCLPPLKWINDLWRAAQPSPRRILSAGCGTGNEVFAFRERFPEAEIVGVDFCTKSIAIARRLQRAQRLRGIRFVVGELGDERLPAKIRGTFDFISCHGVLAYVPHRQVALRNFAQLLAPDGAIYLGVNGAAHFSLRWRTALAEFGFDATTSIPADDTLPAAIAVLDALTGDGVAPVARREASFLPTDLFGPLIKLSSLKELLAECREAGLYFLGEHDERPRFRQTVDRDAYVTLMPRSRAAVAEIIDAVQPAGFHKLLLSKRLPADPPWHEPDKLIDWRPLLARHLREHPWPARRKPARGLRTFTIKSKLFNTRVELRTNESVLDVLREADGNRSLGEILATTTGSIRNQTLRKHLYLLHHLYLLDFTAPGST